MATGLDAKIEAAVNRLSVQDILDAEDIQYEDVQVPEWGGVVTVRSLTAGALTDIQQQTTVGEEVDQARAAVLLLAAGCYRPTLTPETAQQIWDAKNADSTIKVLTAIKKLNGIDRTEAQAEHPFQVS
jgi:hypothetical protein